MYEPLHSFGTKSLHGSLLSLSDILFIDSVAGAVLIAIKQHLLLTGSLQQAHSTMHSPAYYHTAVVTSRRKRGAIVARSATVQELNASFSCHIG